MLFAQILQLPLLVSFLGLLVFEFLLGNDPEVVDSLTFILVESCEIFFFLDLLLQHSDLFPDRLLVVFVVNVVDGIGLCLGLFFQRGLLLFLAVWLWLSSHI
jgi:hypothetical protein